MLRCIPKKKKKKKKRRKKKALFSSINLHRYIKYFSLVLPARYDDDDDNFK